MARLISISALFLVALSACNVEWGPSMTYDALEDFSGPACGVDWYGATVHCLPGDQCLSDFDETCNAATTCNAIQAGDSYDASWEYWGKDCGTDSDGYTTYCHPGDRCDDAGTLTCVYVVSPCLN